MRPSFLLAPAMLCCGTPAWADTRIAYSQKLGLEVLADSPAWCGPMPSFRVVGQTRQTFSQPETPALLQRVGGVVAGQCSAATGAQFAGSVQGSSEIVWRGKAGPADGWVLHAADAGAAVPPSTPPGPTAAAPAPSPPDLAPAAAAVRPPVASPLLGEWVGATGCDASNQVATTISVAEVDGPAAHAVVQVAPLQFRVQQGLLRYQADGSFDAASGQFILRRGAVVRANGDSPQEITGAIDGSSGTMTLQGGCYGRAVVQRLSRVSQDPALARRVAEDRTRRAEWTEQAVNRPKPEGRLVGVLPRGVPRQPSCAELLAWAASFPLDLRVRLQDAGGEAMLRQYDDQNSARVFGVPAYYWITTDGNGRRQQAVNPREIAVHACPPTEQRDPRFNVLMQVTGDGASMNALANRRHTDDLVDALPARIATTGGTAAEMYDDLAPLVRPEPLLAAFQNMTGWSQQSLTPANQAQLMSEARRLRGLLAARALDDTRTAIAAVPPTLQGMAEVRQAMIAFRGEFTEAADSVDEVGAARRADIAATLAQAAAAELEAEPKTLAGLAAAQKAAAAAKAELGHDLPDGGASIDAALRRYQDAATPTVLAAETAALAAVPATPDGVKELAERRAKVLDAAGAEATQGYRAAVDARLAAMAGAREPLLQAGLAALDESWASVGKARVMGRDAAQPFGGSPAAAALRNQGEARAAAIVEALGGKAVAAIRATPGNSIPQIAQVVEAGAAAAAPFEQDPAGKAQADRVRKAAEQRARDLADAYFPTYRAMLASAAPTEAVARRLAVAWVILDRGLKTRVPTFARYVEPTRDAALRVQSSACDQAAMDLGLSSSDAKLPMMIGNRVSTLGAFACAMRDAGVKHGKLAAPSGGGTDYTFKMFAPAGGGGRAGGFAGGTPGSGTLEDMFVFTEPAARTGPASDDDIDDVQVVMLRMVEIGVDRKALVGVQVGDEAKLKAFSVPEWRQFSAGMIAGGQQHAVSAEDCAAFAADPGQLAIQAAPDALLGCVRKR